MERSYLLLTGSLGGLISILTQVVVWSIVAAWVPRARESQLAQLDLLEILLHMLAGVGLGLLFWLSWGLTAIVDVSWGWRGLAFGGLIWLALAVPAVASVTATRQLGMQTLVAFAARWLITCVIVGLACAWNWQRGL